MSVTRKTIRTTCPYCGVGCGVKVSQKKTGDWLIEGDESHPANYGRLCTKGRALGETLSTETRFGFPLIEGKQTSWRKATAYVASQLSQIIDEHGPDAVAFYVSGQLLTEDYYVANKLMKGFIGSGNIDTNSRLCMSSPVVAHKKAFGSDSVPVNYRDLENADLIVLAGSNLAWCHPVLFQRITAAKAQRPSMKIVAIDPRVTATSQLADLHLPIKSGQDLLLFNALLCHLVDHGHSDTSYFVPHELAATLSAARRDFSDIHSLAKTLHIDIKPLEVFFQLFANNEKVVTIFSQGINQSELGVDQASAIINCHLVTNRIGRPGMGPLSITGQPNAMGGREVGGMATSLASHLSFEDNEAHRILSTFWQTDRLAKKPGLSAIKLFDGVANGTIKAVWIMATNPAVSMPNSQKIKTALANCPLVVVSESFQSSETAKYAKVVFPATPWGEKSGTVTNAERRVSRQRAFNLPYQESRPDWWIICQVAKAMGFNHSFDFNHEAEIFTEHASLSKLAFKHTKSFSLSPMADLNYEQYDTLTPFQWPQVGEKNISLGDIRPFVNGQFHTPDGRPNMIPVSLSGRLTFDSSEPLTDNNSDVFFTLNSGRVRDQWHSMTRTALASQLNYHSAEALLYIHPADAEKQSLSDGSIIQLENKRAKVMRKVRVSTQVSRSELFTPMHWSGINQSAGEINQLIGDQHDLQSGQPAFKQARVKVAAISMKSKALLLSRQPIPDIPCDYWTRQKVPQGYLYFIDDRGTEKNLFDRLYQSITNAYGKTDNSKRLNHLTAEFNRYTQFSVGSKQLLWLVTAWPGNSEPDSSWLSRALEEDFDEASLASLFSNIPFKNFNRGSPLCLCVNIRRDQVIDAAKQDSTVQGVCQATGAGKACGTCLGDIALALATME